MFNTKRTAAIIAAATGAALVLAGCSGGGSTGGGEYDPDEKVTLDFSFWGNDVRAGLYDEAIALFNEEYPNITVRTSFLTYPEYWEKRQTEAAGGGLPDVMQTDVTYLRQYTQNNLLLDLEPYFGEQIDTEPFDETLLDAAVVNDVTAGVPISTNAWGMFSNPTLLAEIGVEDFPGGDWDDYNAWIEETTAAAEAAGVEAWGGGDWTGRIQVFELQQRAKGEDLFTEDGEANFTKEDLADFWNQTADLREDGAFIPQQRVEELNPLGGFDAAKTATEMTWDNFGAGYLANLGEGYPELGLTAPPVTEEGADDLYLKASMLLSASQRTDHPEAAAILIDFLVNDPEVGAVFGTNRGLPASETARSSVELAGLDAQIEEYEASIADRLGATPPVAIVGFGSLEEKFRVLGTELNFGTTTVDQAVDQFFTEMDVVLNS